MHPSLRSNIPRRKTDEVVTHTWLQRKALWWLGSIFVVTVGAAWSVSAQVEDLKQDVREAQALAPLVTALTHEVLLLRKGQDSLVTLMTDRERRNPPNPLVNR